MFVLKIARAAEETVVSCSGSDCTVCGALSTVSRVINFLMGISAVAAVLILVLAGIAYIFTTGRKRFLEKAKVFARKGVIGFGLILVSWLVIRTLFFVSGYQGINNWWSLSCETGGETVSSHQTDLLNDLKTYPDIAVFLASADKKARIAEPVPLSSLMAQLDKLMIGEELTLYLPAVKVKNNTGIQVPFLAGYKSSQGEFTIDPETTKLLERMLEKVVSGEVSFLGKGGSTLSLQTSENLTNSLISMVWESVIKSLQTNNFISSSTLEQLSSAAGGDVTQKISALSGALREFQQSNLDSFGKESKTSQMITDLVNGSLDRVDELVVARSSTADRSAGSTSSDGDRGQTVASKGSEKKKEPESQSSQEKRVDKFTDSGQATPITDQVNPTNIPPGPMTPVSKDNWGKSKDPKKPDPGQIGDDFGDMDKDRDKKKPDELSADDWNPGDGSPEAIKKALRRINKRDYLRYEMMFRYVKHIGDAPGGGMCTGCGDIMVDHRARILDIAHIAVHEGTHSGHACTVGWGGFSEGELEAIACANQQGSLYRGKDPDMKEFPRARESINYKGKEVRGHLARYWTGVNPKGDLNDEILGGLFKAMTDYPISKGWSNQGEYPYGWGEGYHLRINKRLEDVVKTVMTKEGPIDCKWGSCPTSDLPKLSVKCDCEQIKID